MTWDLAASVFLITIFGYLVGGVLAWMCRLDRSKIMTIALASGFQHGPIAMLVVQFSFPPPFNDIAAAVPIITMILGRLPLWIMLAILRIRDRIKARADKKKAEVDLESKPKESGSSSSDSKANPLVTTDFGNEPETMKKLLDTEGKEEDYNTPGENQCNENPEKHGQDPDG